MVKIMGFLQTIDGILTRLYADYVKLGKYFAVGAIGTIAEWSLYSALIIFTLINYTLATAVAYFLGMIINYTLNRYFTFNSSYKKIHIQFASFAVVALIGLGIQEVVMVGLVGYMFNNTSADTIQIISKVAATFIGFIWTFIANKKITFKIFK